MSAVAVGRGIFISGEDKDKIRKGNYNWPPTEQTAAVAFSTA